MQLSAALTLGLLALLTPASATRLRLVPPAVPLPPAATARISNSTGNFVFTQLLDHDLPHGDTFGQHVWWNSEHWGGPGSPIILFTPGETAADEYEGYLTNATLTGKFAQEVNGAVVMVEHRYWGESSPYADLTGHNLKQLTLRNSIADFVRIAATAQLPFDPSHKSDAAHAPWIMMGGSYAGSLSAWTESVSPGTFWAYHSSSAPVEAIDDYWQYFVPVEKAMPRNCSSDVSKAVEYIDKVFAKGSQKEQVALKEKFGLGKLRNDDFSSVLEYGPSQEQSNTFYTPQPLTIFCDYVEGTHSNSTGASTNGVAGVGVAKALEGYAQWVKQVYLPESCQVYGYEDPASIECYDTYNPDNKLFTDHTVGNAIDRQWQWMLCNEPFGWWQGGAPKNHKTIVSRNINTAYWQRQCELFFPPSQGSPNSAFGRTVDVPNHYTSGWTPRKSKRLLYVNGELDPWRTAGVSSEFRPGGPLTSTEEIPVIIIPGGFHCSDLILKNYIDPGVKKVVDKEIEILKGWVGEWYEGKPGRGAKRGVEGWEGRV
ncbi:hypothetical protein VC83_03247 [Pseudogymnoascus destructans]|uniref:Thymus-specific serine protease n=1 Tax=Pseudogymnoascus destructans TaxID=655981 RepID=A0A177AE27_9PEZI|nr:uncharacterized protein VC83_03247 [Pseudogymnoascus destructans]OAF60366.1 hypothetical protein VC83_03247 [Pseudogymnoascus destructans]